ncbi:FecR domain-containing protein [Sneathiella sp.]|uniref:FecR family protein n=1 Tax=Sneathiella sp. TaxID=1964365 RepID=UPI00260BB8AD|nr:FecR domain-containing protein [Sneathiella sp.]MDF2368648.1 FecR domain-containing protein [Sneathiella sp.]
MVDIFKEIGEPTSAIDWMIALREQPKDPELRRKLEVWLKADPARGREWKELQQMSSLFKALPESEETKIEEIAALPPTPKKSGFSRRSYLVTAGIVMATVLFLFAVPSENIPGTVYTTEIAQSLNIDLEDGSHVLLAPETKLSVQFEKNERQVSLIEGSAFFDVAKNPEKPFIVSTREVEIKVLGTAFEVATRLDALEVSVAEGTVAVTNAKSSESFKLGLGDRLRQYANANWQKDTVRVDSIASWRENLFVARESSLEALVDQLSDYHNGVIYISDDALRKMQVTGVYRLNEPEKALDMLARSHPIKIQKITPWVILLGKK